MCEEGGCECVGGGTAVIGVGVNGFLGSSSLFNYYHGYAV